LNRNALGVVKKLTVLVILFLFLFSSTIALADAKGYTDNTSIVGINVN